MFLAPLFLIGLLAAGVPLLLHLRRTRRVKNVLFSTTRFFDERFVQSSRRARFQDVLVMLLRVGLITLFVLALAQPLFRLPGLAALAGGKRTVAIVIDDSASMAATGAEGSSLDKAKRGAMRIIDDLSPLRGDRATLILAGRRESGVRVLFPDPSNDAEALRDAVRQIEPTDLAGDIPSAVDQARQIIGAPAATPQNGAGSGGAGAREVYVFSDMQASGFGEGEAVSGGLNTSVVFVACDAAAGGVADNISVDAIQYGTSRPMVGVPFTFAALVTNHGRRERVIEARLLIDDQVVAHKPITVSPGRGRLVRFVHRFAKPGWHPGRVEIGPDPAADAKSVIDAVTADDRRHFAVHVEQKASILAIDGAPSSVPVKDELFFLRVALAANTDVASPAADRAAIEVTTLTPEQITPDRLKPHALVVLANVGPLNAAALEALEHYVDAGGNLFITCGDHTTPSASAPWSSQGRLHGGLLPGRLTQIVGESAAAEDAAGIIGSVADEHPALAGFADGRFGLLTGVTFRSRIRFDAPPESVLMRTADGDPLLAEKRFGRGRVLLFGSTIDRDWTNFPLQPAYVPWLYRIVGYCVQPSLSDAGFVAAGRVVALPSSTTQTESLQVVEPDGTASAAIPGRPSAQRVTPPLEFTATEHAGVYRVRSATDGADTPPRYLFSVNIPGDESEPTRFDKEALSTAMSPDTTWSYADGPDAAVEVGQVARQGLGLWDQLLLAALLVAVFEPWLANRLSRRRLQAEPDAMSRRDAGPSTPHKPERSAA
ncbi:MAG: BatA domain-containing protein [Planctomycetes bacterium]|nr:BatA domain-containing protein [Planctomycetota bacterium]